MKKRGIWTIVSVLVVLGLILASCAKAPAPTTPTAPKAPTTPKAPTAPTAPAPAQPEVYKLVTQSGTLTAKPIPGPINGLRYPLFPTGSSYEAQIDLMERYSGGRLKIELAPYDSIVLWTEALPGVSRGAIDMMMGLLHGTAAGIIPEADILNGLPLQYQNWEEHYDALYNWGLLDEVQPLFEKENVHIVPRMGASWNVIMIKGDVRSLSDLKAKRIRAVGAMNTLVTALGGTALIIPYSEGYMAMKLGTIDGWIASPVVTYMYKFYETSDVFSQIVYPKLGAWTNSNAFNLDSWNALPQDLRDTIEELAPMHAAWQNAVNSWDWSTNVSSYMEGLGQVQTVEFSEEDANAIIQAAYKQWDDKYGKKSANMARLVELGKRMVAAWGRPFPGYKAGW